MVVNSDEREWTWMDEGLNTFLEYMAEYNITQKRNREEGLKTRLQRLDELEDFYNENDKFTTTNKDRNKYKSFINGLKDWEKAAYERAMEDGKYIYFMDFENVGGLISPLPLKITFENGEIEELMVPAEIWRRNSKNVTKLITRKKRIASIELDPHHQTADSNYSNNSFPPSIRRSRIELYKSNYKPKSMMADMLVELKSEGKDGSNNTGKDVPLSNTDGSTADHKSKTNKLNEKESGSLRKTLEKLLSRD